MSKIRITNKRAGNTVKLPGGIKIKKGRSAILPSSILSHSSVRKLLTRGRLVQSSIASQFDSIEGVTDSTIEKGRDAVENAIDSAIDSVSEYIDAEAAKEAVEDVLDTVENAVESAVDGALDAVEDVVEGVVDSVLDFLGGDDEEEEKPKPKKRRTRKKKSE